MWQGIFSVRVIARRQGRSRDYDCKTWEASARANSNFDHVQKHTWSRIKLVSNTVDYGPCLFLRHHHHLLLLESPDSEMGEKAGWKFTCRSAHLRE